MKRLKERGSSTIKRAVEAISSPQQAFVENIGEVAVEKPVREKTQTSHLRVSVNLLELMKSCAAKHSISMKSFVQLSALSMCNASNELVAQACAELFKVDSGAATERATLKSSEKFVEMVIPDLASRFNGNISLAFKASAAYVAGLPDEEASALIQSAIQVDMRMNYRLTSASR
jgi:hypothetical protein